MTAPAVASSGLGWTIRRRLAVGLAAALAWAVLRAGVNDEVVNTRGWDSFARFWGDLRNPELASDFLELTVDAGTITLSFAVLGTLLSLLLGAFGALLLSELLNGRTFRWHVVRSLLVVPRAVHEVLWALLLIQIFGFDPLVAILAIGLPFGAVTAKVFAETIDEADHGPYLVLRSAGASRLSALAYGVLPTIWGDLVSYSFYRLECALRSAAVLGVIGAGGLGFQLDLSFESLLYSQIWTLILALMLLSGLADAWSSAVRRSSSGVANKSSLLVLVLLVPLCWRWTGLSLSGLWSERSRSLAVDLAADLFPGSLGPGGWGELWNASVDTVAMSILAGVLAAIFGLALGVLSSRSKGTLSDGLGGAAVRWIVRLLLLLFRAVPAPIWAFLFVLILFPGLWPGAVALAVYNVGVLGRLYAETLEEAPTESSDALVLSGASSSQAFFYGRLPEAAPRLVSLTLYRWEVIVRETVMVGVVGAGGLGQLIREHLAARDFAAVTSAIVALIAISLLIDTISGAVRRVLR